ncbi:MAG: PrsW family intramembrane metalloprotease [Deltaproteobacteria bacterium]|nr:PrsW family intramembrane metalloprotease [Deltaproteobacteria bacterium]
MNYITIAVTVLPSILLFLYIYTHDEHPEPKSLITKVALGGALSAIPVFLFVMLLNNFFAVPADAIEGSLYTAFIQAAFPEEFFKMSVVMLIAYGNIAFDEPYDGIVYGAASSLGFATLENFLYVGQGGLNIAIIRAVTAIPLHIFCGVIMGYFIGRARFTRTSPVLWFGLAYLIPAALHGFYDFGAFFADRTGDEVGVAVFAGTLVFTIIMGIILLKSLEKNNVKYMAHFYGISLEKLKSAIPKGVLTESVLPQIIKLLKDEPQNQDQLESFENNFTFSSELQEKISSSETRKTRGFVGFLYAFLGISMVIIGGFITSVGAVPEAFPPVGEKMTFYSSLSYIITGFFIVINGLFSFKKGMFRNRKLHLSRTVKNRVGLFSGFLLTLFSGFGFAGTFLKDSKFDLNGFITLIVMTISGLLIWGISLFSNKKSGQNI